MQRVNLSLTGRQAWALLETAKECADVAAAADRWSPDDYSEAVRELSSAIVDAQS